MQYISETMKWMWRKWKSAVHRINDVISFVLMTITYLIAVTPVSLIMKAIYRDILDRGLGSPQTESYWLKVERRTDADTTSGAQRQY